MRPRKQKVDVFNIESNKCQTCGKSKHTKYLIKHNGGARKPDVLFPVFLLQQNHSLCCSELAFEVALQDSWLLPVYHCHLHKAKRKNKSVLLQERWNLLQATNSAPFHLFVIFLIINCKLLFLLEAETLLGSNYDFSLFVLLFSSLHCFHPLLLSGFETHLSHLHLQRQIVLLD